MSDIVMTSRPTSLQHALGNSRGSSARVAADWLCLAATPTFAIISLLTALSGGEPEILCAAMHHASPLSGMIPMYLMSAFHSAPWLKLICSRYEARPASANGTIRSPSPCMTTVGMSTDKAR